MVQQLGLGDTNHRTWGQDYHGGIRIVTVHLANMSNSVETIHDLDPEDTAALLGKLLKRTINVLTRYWGRFDNIVGYSLNIHVTPVIAVSPEGG